MNYQDALIKAAHQARLLSSPGLKGWSLFRAAINEAVAGEPSAIVRVCLRANCFVAMRVVLFGRGEPTHDFAPRLDAMTGETMADLMEQAASERILLAMAGIILDGRKSRPHWTEKDDD